MSQRRTNATYTVREVGDVAPSRWDGWLRDSPGGERAAEPARAQRLL